MNFLQRRFSRLCTSTILAMFSTNALATTFDFEGVIATCNSLACGAADIGVGDPIAGFVKAADAASGPNSTFGPADITDYRVVLNTLSVGPADGTIVSAAATTDANGELVSGSLVFLGFFDGGILGQVDLELTIDLTAETFSVSTMTLNLGVIATGSAIWSLEADGDGLAAIEDNCIVVANAGQQDADVDGIGNQCDADFDQNCFIDFLDLGAMKGAFFGSDPVIDLNSDGLVDFLDLGILKSLIFQEPGPSGIANACAI